MTYFKDGPADGQALQLARAPKLIRVVRSASGKWDALDQLADTPELDETLFAYRLHGEPTLVHMLFGGRDKHKSGWYRAATYLFIEPQPDDATIRDTQRWREWCRARIIPEAVTGSPVPQP